MNEGNLDIKPQHIARQNVVGHIKGNPVTHIRTLGGLEILCWTNKGTPEVIAAAPHIGVSNFIAQKKHPDIVFTELKKSEAISPYFIESQADLWGQVTQHIVEAFNRVLGK